MTTRRRPPANDTALLLEMIREQGRAIEGLRRVIEEGNQRSSDGRSRLHERMDEFATHLGKIEGDIAILGQVDAQVRTELQTLAGVVEDNRVGVAPAVEAWADFGKLLKTGKRISIIFSLAGVTTIGGLLGALTGVWSTVGDWIRALLRAG